MSRKTERQAERLQVLVTKLLTLPAETEWVEFKENNFKAEDVGEYISALSNGATLNNQEKGYLVWGVRDSDHKVTGTNVNPQAEKVGNEDLVPWLTRQVQPQVHFEFHALQRDGKMIVLLEIGATHTMPVRFKDFEYIRVGSYKKKLRDHPDHARRLWNTFNQVTFEENSSMSSLNDQEVLELIDYQSYYALLQRPALLGPQAIVTGLEDDSVIRRIPHSDNWEITNLGAMLFARDISDFTTLKRKALRIVQYRGDNRISTVREQVGMKGYASGFEGAVHYLNNLLPSNEVIGEAIRKNVPVYPPLAVRELLANALIHQDFSQSGNGPMVEVFDGRLEITSPGHPLIAPARFVDAPPKSRNEKLASLMRRAGICEERGSGWDKIAFDTEFYQLPAPVVELPGESTRVILFGPKAFAEMDKDERLRAVYLHACLRYVERNMLTNTSLRERFRLEQDSASQISRLISDAVDADLIIPFDATAGRRFMKYVPFWAGDSSNSL
ncbi:ATP-binding protein [Actinokineospora iranica]|uniref:Predicted transcriptional regulator, contains HTH domain n=1 Tax=Actinokineospora iranica TaxID=1271860 RepID=A0A1G6SZR9_9PSEU|nr:RNA-binding domain-containing protein [Actinokineospora iranica]SDD22249.1 Predicted transcriptional regulator, contains HTH domain [Actinokineospora iranica]